MFKKSMHHLPVDRRCTVREAMLILSRSRTSLYLYARSGLLTKRRAMFGRVYFDRQEVMDLKRRMIG